MFDQSSHSDQDMGCVPVAANVIIVGVLAQYQTFSESVLVLRVYQALT
jgi:hypothetical protein